LVALNELQRQKVPHSVLLRLFRKLFAEIRYGKIIIHHSLEIEELINILESMVQRGEIPPRYLERFVKELLLSIDKAGLPPSLRLEIHSLLLDRLHRYAHFHFPEEVEEGREKKEEEEESEKVLQAISKIKIQEEDKILFFLGAGASKPEPSNIPTINELLPELWEKSSRMETRPLEKLQRWCEENNIENIEEMLTAVTISNFIIKNSKVHGLLNSVLYPEWPTVKEISIRDIDAILLLENMLNTFFSLLVGTMLQAKPNKIHKAIARYTKENSRRVDMLTTNYDACIDQALNELGVKYNYVLDASENPDTVNLVKMHGSINWFYCDTCQSVFLPSIEAIEEAIKKDVPYGVISMCSHCSAPARQLIIPPITYKYLTHPPIVQVWDCGRRILEQTKVFVIIGYSFSLADDYIAKMLVKAIGQDPEKYVIVVNIDKKAINRCKSLIKSHVDAFDENKRFFPLQGDGIKLVPKVIKALIEAEQNKKSKKKKATS